MENIFCVVRYVTVRTALGLQPVSVGQNLVETFLFINAFIALLTKPPIKSLGALEISRNHFQAFIFSLVLYLTRKVFLIC